MFKVGRLRDALKYAFTAGGRSPSKVEAAIMETLKSTGLDLFLWGLFGEGINCEILKLGAKGWGKGKIRIRFSVDFCPEEPEFEHTTASNEPEISLPESPLDDIRRMMNENS